jgi:hypothetical protein
MTVLFDAVGAGNTAVVGFNPSVNTTWTHTSLGAALVGLTSLNNGEAPSAETSAVTYGGVAMNRLLEIDIGTQTFVELWGLLKPLSGAQTVSVTVTGPGNTGRAVVASSVSYTGVRAFGAVTTNSGNSAASSLTVAANPGEMIVNAVGSGVTQSSYSQTQRYNQIVSGNAADLVIGDALGAASVNFATALSSSFWASGAVRLLPILGKPMNLNQSMQRASLR